MGPLYYPRITSDPTYYILSARRGCQVPSGDDNDTHKNKYKARIKTNTKKKCFKGSLHVIFLKSMGLKDLKFYIGYHLLMTMTQHTNTKTKTKCFNDPRYDLLAIVQFMVWAPWAPWAPNTINICWAPKMSWAPIASKKHVGSNGSPAHFGSPADIDGVGSPGSPGRPDRGGKPREPRRGKPRNSKRC